MTHTTTHAQATLPQKPARPPSPDRAEGHPHAQADTSPTADGNHGKLSDLVAALHAHEAQDADLKRRAEQAALQARQRFD